MDLISYNPWEVANKFFDRDVLLSNGRELGKFANNRWLPEVDIEEDDNQFKLTMDVPGVKSGNVDVTVEKGILFIKGSRSEETTEKKKNYTRTERFKGSFSRSFTLPDTADHENIEAHVDNGVLEVIIPKTAKSQPKKITVKTK